VVSGDIEGLSIRRGRDSRARAVPACFCFPRLSLYTLPMAWASKLAMRSHGQLFDGVRSLSSRRIPDIFSPNTAEFVAAAGTVSSIPLSMRLPEVVVTGRANVGKSTLLNAVMGRKRLVASSKKPVWFRLSPTWRRYDSICRAAPKVWHSSV